MSRDYNPERDENLAVSRYWLTYYCGPDVCSLCGNSGQIDTRTVLSPRGLPAGRVNFCICPNGQAMRWADTLARDEVVHALMPATVAAALCGSETGGVSYVDRDITCPTCREMAS